MRSSIILLLILAFACKKKNSEPAADSKLKPGTEVYVNAYCNHKSLVLKVENVTQKKTLFYQNTVCCYDKYGRATWGCYFKTNNQDNYKISWSVSDSNKALYITKPLKVDLQFEYNGTYVDLPGKIENVSDTILKSVGEYFIN